MTTATQLQIRRDTATNLAAATPAAGELGYDTTNNRIVVGDGATAGGIRIPSAADLQKSNFNYADDTSASANTITVAFTPATLADGAGQRLLVNAANANTGSTTIEVDTRSACTLKKIKNGAYANLQGGEIFAGHILDLLSLGSSEYLLLNPAPSSASSGLVLLKATAASALSSLAFNSSYITSTYDNYLIEIDSLTSSSQTPLQLTISGDNGSTFGTGYAVQGTYTVGSSPPYTGACSTPSSGYIDVFGKPAASNGSYRGMPGSGSYPCRARIEFSKPSANQSQLFDIKAGGSCNTDDTSTYNFSSSFIGLSPAMTFNYLKLSVASGNFTCTARLYGYQNS